jgi:Raf kinase inhibitor-like YbhB/YbcL family protein
MSTILDRTKSLIGHLLRNVHSSSEKLTSAHAPAHAAMSVTSSSFAPGMPIPIRFTQDAENLSPAISWQGLPAGTKSLALVCEDPDAPTIDPIVHWIAFNIPATATGLPEEIPAGAIPGGGEQGKNYNGEIRYTGPKPPLGHGVHHYHFQLFALDQTLTFTEPPEKNDLLQAMQNHVLAQGEVVGTYEREIED